MSASGWKINAKGWSFYRLFAFMGGSEEVRKPEAERPRMRASAACPLGKSYSARFFNFRRDLGKKLVFLYYYLAGSA